MKTKRVVTKIGDIFSVNVDREQKKFFQLIAFDITQLNSDVIRAFKKRYPINEIPELSEVVKDRVDFYAHCVTKWGVKLGYWEKIGSSAEVGPLNHILFRDSSDYGKPAVRISEDWWVWRINGEQKRVGSLEGV